MLCNQADVVLFAQIENCLHFSVFTLVIRRQVLFNLRNGCLEDVSSWLVVFVLFADQKQKLLYFSSENSRCKDVEVGEAG